MKNKSLIFFQELINNIKFFKITDICAQTSFYFVLSFFPFLLIFTFLLSLLPINTEALLVFINQHIPTYLDPIINDDFLDYYLNIDFSVVSLSFLIAIFSASSITSVFLRLLNEIYQHDNQRSSVKNRIISIFLNFLFISLIFMFFIFIIILSSFINILANTLHIQIPFISHLINFLILPFFMFSILMLIYAASDFIKHNFKKYFVGSFISTLLLIFSFYLLNIYFLYFSPYLTYGMIGTFIVLLLYFYCVSFIIFLGAIINKILYF